MAIKRYLLKRLLYLLPVMLGAWAECVLVEEISRKNYSLVIGKVVHLEADDRFFNQAGEMDYELAGPLSVMLGDRGMWFTRPVFAGRYAEYAEMFISGKDGVPAYVSDNSI